MIASTLPSALVRSPRRANGLNSGSTWEASLDEQVELVGAARRAVGERVVAHFLIEHHHVLHQHRMQRPGVEEQHPTLERLRTHGA